jgi:hypothetical protein
MNLSQVYTSHVKHNPINNFASSFGGMPQIEKDPIIAKLEKDVMLQMQHLMPKEETIQQPQISVKILSPEEALKELINLSKS